MPSADAPADAPAPLTITRPGWTPATRHKLFVNMPVADVQRTITFFESLGFRFNPHFTDHAGTCMLVGEDAYVMFLTHERFKGFSRRPIGDLARESNALFTVSVESRAAVDAMVHAAEAAGGTRAGDPEDHGFMYDWSFHDLDGHGWGVFWMDPAALPAEATAGRETAGP